MARVLRAARIPVYVWREGQFPSATEARSAFAVLLGPAAVGIKPTFSRPMPLTPPDFSRRVKRRTARHQHIRPDRG